MTMSLISTITQTGSSSAVFNSIPQDGTDLLILYSVRSLRNNTIDDIIAQFNGSTSGYTMRLLTGNGATASSTNPVQNFFELGQVPALTATASTFANGSIYIPNYTSRSVAKSLSSDNVTEQNGTTAFQNLIAGSWSGTDAITSISVGSKNAFDASGSTYSLYKITRGSDGIVVVS